MEAAMRLLIGIDDTDNLESIGTGEVLENLCAALEERRLGRGGFVTRHQLFVHEDIPYTSHNSAMVCEADVFDLEQTIAFCRDYMDVSCAEGSDPGLCIVDPDRLTEKSGLIRFGVSAKILVLTKQDALETASRHPSVVWLSEHGGTGGGIIGALAGCGLRLTGSDGKIKGKLNPPKGRDVISVRELCDVCGIPGAMDSEKHPIGMGDTVWFSQPTKAVYRDSKLAVYLAADSSGRADWRVYGIQELKGLVD
jgi:hypothetical protein